ncbi:hypothetical protein [Aeromicrobium wangtongii]|uniref:hypothetical protein n=1 Tax=Aeromicrobium wangtongii TaxID=2969247 RepID=UPI002018067B|nr:hypothetical protein [Aeromicrobium wangtongii]MCL3817718.1 hypothetical protein [Aeromicrobium wangtongii]
MKTFAAACATALLLAGCGGSSDDEPAADPTTTAPTTAAAAPTSPPAEGDDAETGVVDIVIKDGAVTPQGGRVEVKVGQEITLKITSDAAEEIHVHSDPEHSYEVAPGDSLTESFTLKTPGQVAVEAHHLGVTVVQLVVRP